MSLDWVRRVSFSRRLLLLAATISLTVGLAPPALAQTPVEDQCLVGNWTYGGAVVNGENGEEMTGAVTLNFPSPTAGSATLSVEIQTELGIRHYAGTAGEPYDVGSASTPSDPAGALSWTDPTGIDVIPDRSAPGDYSCSDGELTIAVPLAFGAPLTFSRSSVPPAPETVQVLNQGTGLGTVMSEPSAIDCPAICSALFWQGTRVQLTALRDVSWFMGWTGPCTPLAPITNQVGNLPDEKTCQLASGGEVTATFGKTLAVTITGAGTVTGSPTTTPLPDGFPFPPTINCPENCGAYFAQEATLVATPADGYKFGGWATGPCSPPASDTCHLAMTELSLVTAIFTTVDLEISKLQGSLARSFKGRHYEQTTMRPGTTLWRGETEIGPGKGSHFKEAYFGLEQPTSSAEAEKLYNLAIWKNNADCLQQYEVTEPWRAYYGGVAGRTGSKQVLAAAGRGRARTVPWLLREKYIRRVGPCQELPLVN